jgi:preprotein translocase subunit SecE
VKKIISYFKDVQNELKKVSWPSQEELVDYTIVVVVFTIILAIFIFAIDQLFSTILHAIYQ